MSMVDRAERLRMLVTITCYGLKNSALLEEVVARYEAMELDVDVIVLSDRPRSLGPRTRVLVGLPSADPWSLPFAHKAVLRENVDRYDLFAYSEDDMGVTEQNVRAFVQVTRQLRGDEIAGFLRFEQAPDGSRSLPDVHGGYRWRPESVQRRGDCTIAEFSNEHAAFFLLTQEQLKSMIAHDGFAIAPYTGQYDMACTAATDPYTRYRYRKVICISRLDDFLIHHLSNRYAGLMGVPMRGFRQQVQALLDIAEGSHPASTLLSAESRWPDGRWAKNLYETPDDDALALIPNSARSILSIGCGWGATEARLVESGLAVTALPYDSVIARGEFADRLSIECGPLEQCVQQLHGQQFDCVLMSDLLHLVHEPYTVVQWAVRFVAEGGAFIVSGPNFGSVRVVAKRIADKDGYRKLRSFEESGIHRVGPGTLAHYLKSNGFGTCAVQWSLRNGRKFLSKRLGGLVGERWTLRAARPAATSAAETVRSL